MKKITSVLAVNFVALYLASSGQALTIDMIDSPDNLAQSLVGSGITISNVSYTAYSELSHFCLW